MKKLNLLSAGLLFGMMAFSCSSDDDDAPAQTCEQATAATLTAELAFDASTAADYPAKCVAYKAALQNEIAICGDTSGELQLMIDDLGDCTVNAINGIISVGVGSAPLTFEEITVTTNGTTRTVHGEDNDTSYWIEFDIPVGETGLDKISNFNIHILSYDYTPMPDGSGGDWQSNITVNSTTTINGTFSGYVSSPDTFNQQDLVNGMIDIDL